MVLSYAADGPLVTPTKKEATRVEAIRPVRRSYVDSEAADTWARTLEQIPTTSGRLVYVSSLREKDTKRYQHQGLARIYSPEQADRVLRASHESVFAEWLSFSLEQQYNDLRVHLLTSEPTPEQMREMLDPKTYDRFIPVLAHDPERMLYRTDMQTVLELLKRDL